MRAFPENQDPRIAPNAPNDSKESRIFFALTIFSRNIKWTDRNPYLNMNWVFASFRLLPCTITIPHKLTAKLVFEGRMVYGGVNRRQHEQVWKRRSRTCSKLERPTLSCFQLDGKFEFASFWPVWGPKPTYDGAWFRGGLKEVQEFQGLQLLTPPPDPFPPNLLWIADDPETNKKTKCE